MNYTVSQAIQSQTSNTLIVRRIQEKLQGTGTKITIPATLLVDHPKARRQLLHCWIRDDHHLLQKR
jgi:hypothetical protein